MLTTGGGRPRGIGDVGRRRWARARCEGNWSPQTSQFSGSFGNGDDLADGEVMGPTPAAGNDGLPTIPHASAELPSGRELLKTGRPN